jgi:hypothetical protein
MKNEHTHDLTKPQWNWRKNFNRLRIGYMTPYRWWLYGAMKWHWFIYFSNNERKNWATNEVIGKYIQITFFGFQIAYLYWGREENEKHS